MRIKLIRNFVAENDVKITFLRQGAKYALPFLLNLLSL